MPQGRMRRSVDRSIRAAVRRGSLDLEAQAAPIAMLRYMADFLDRPSEGAPATRYVTPASFLAYCEALGLTPQEDEAPKAGRDTDQTSLGSIRGKFRAVS